MTDSPLNDFFLAIGLALAIEGIIYALFPDAMKRFIVQVLAQPTHSVRVSGLIIACLGVAIVWVIRG